MSVSPPTSRRRLLLLGGSGQLGHAVQATALSEWEIDAPSSQLLDLTNGPAIRAYVERTHPSAILNCAAYTRVDDAETDEVRAIALNANAPASLAESACGVGAHFVHLSTDYVFDGAGGAPFGPDAEPRPLNVYGSSKLAGERAVAAVNPDAAIVRTAWLHSGRSGNFVDTVVKRLTAGQSMRVVDDQVGTPTTASELAEVLWQLLERRDVHGVHHVTDAGVASWYDVACCVRDTVAEAGLLPEDTTVTPVHSRDFPRPARRPAVSILSTYHTRVALEWTPKDWREGVRASTMTLLAARMGAGVRD